MKKQHRELSDEALELIAARFRVLAEPMRLKILNALGEVELNVNEIVEATGSGQANISKHLGILFNEGLVARRKEGLNTYYSVADKQIFALCENVCASVDEHLATKQRAFKRGATK
ncbi:MAG: winged helix-turn-helix transcriptional regulator [Acidobacteria bacterium]|nr:winged helix-turn-helix transcriptional regulator [Acidobacteriota bacterium]